MPLLREFLVWMATQLGKGPGEYDPSWSEALASSLNFWGLLEGTHVLSLMLFAGTIFLVDFRLLGIGFRRTPVSVISDKVLPLTVVGFILMVLTGVALFYAKPLLYYHNLWFRLKLLFLAAALVNIVVFHFKVQRNRHEWDTAAAPPAKARISAPVGHGYAHSARWPSTQPRSASAASSKAMTRASPSVATSTPRCAENASRRRAMWTSSRLT